MVKVTYIGANEKAATQGYDFVKGEPVDISNEAVISRLESNRYFEVSQDKKEKEPTVSDYKTALKAAGIEFDKDAKKDALKALADENSVSVLAS